MSSVTTKTHSLLKIPTNVSLVEKSNGCFNIYKITQKGNLSWNIEISEEEIEEDENTIIIPSYMVQQLFSPQVRICQLGKSIIAFRNKFDAIFIRNNTSNVSK